MKKLLSALVIFSSLMGKALAGVPCTLPFTLVNGTLADATQVMANYNALVTCLTAAAASGVNSDITSLTGMTTPLTQSAGGTSVFIGNAASTGTNVQVVAATTPSNFALNNNFRVIFKVGASNTAATTLQVGSAPAANVFRITPQGIKALAGGELIAGAIAEAIYDGTQFQLISNISPFPVGTVLDTINVLNPPDPGFFLLNGSCKSQALFSELYFRLGSPGVGGCGAGNFALPNANGRVLAMWDNGAGVINTYCASVLVLCGNQSTGLIEGNIPSLSSSFTTTITDNRVWAAQTVGQTTGGLLTVMPGVSNTSGSAAQGGVSVTSGTITAGTSYTGSASVFSNLPPMLTVYKQVKY